MNLNPPKLRPLHIFIIAAVLTLLIGGSLIYFWIMPINAENNTLSAAVATLQDQGSDMRKQQAEEDLQAAIAEAEATRERWARLEDRYFRVGPGRSVLDFSPQAGGRWGVLQTLSLEHVETLGPAIERWVAGTGNRLTSSISVEAAPRDPNAIPPDVIPIRIGGVRVAGSYASLLRLLRTTPTMPRLGLIDDVTVTAASGQAVTTGAPPRETVTADIGLMVYIFPRHGEQATAFPLPTGTEGAGPGFGGGAPMGGAPPGMGAPPPPGMGAPPPPGMPGPPPPPGMPGAPPPM
jgi:hypothetical protein